MDEGGAPFYLTASRWPSLSRTRRILGDALDLLLPPRSLDEGERGSTVQSTGLSAAAWSRVAFVEAPFCDGCGAPFEYDMGWNARCAAC